MKFGNLALLRNLLFLMVLFCSNNTFSIFKRDLGKVDAFNYINKLGMRIWTKIDLVKAANSTVKQKCYFISEVLDNVLNLYATLLYCLKLDLVKADKKENILFLIKCIDDSAKSAFKYSECPDSIAIFSIIPKIENIVLAL